MVHYFVPAFALLALSASVAAVPTASNTSPVVFSFVQWIEDIIANPDGDHLTPEEAVAAKNAAMASANPLEKRVNCHDDWKTTNANDAAACLDDLARKGAAGVQCVMGQTQLDVEMCRIRTARLVGTKVAKTVQRANCNDIARTGGLIFDSCWRADNTVKGSEICITNSNIQVNIRGV